jgi:serralysin
MKLYSVCTFLIFSTALLTGLYSCKKSDYSDNTNSSIPRTCTIIASPSIVGSIRRWPYAGTVTIKFLNGDIALQDKVKYYANLWRAYANINFSFVDVNSNADIKIGFQYKGNIGTWSYIGNDAKYAAQTDATMNFGWLNSSTSDAEFQSVVLHEFGHALGLTHEHANPSAGFTWNTTALYDYYSKVNGSSTSDVDANVIKALSITNTNYNAYDTFSIMRYPIPSGFTTNGYNVGWNNFLSDKDKAFIRQMYPFSGDVRFALYPGDFLLQGWYIQSVNGIYTLLFQTDGNLVLYKNGFSQAIWSTFTVVKPYVTILYMQNDGNLVLYDNNYTPYWNTYTYKSPGAFLYLGDDGVLVLYLNGVKIWTN